MNTTGRWLWLVVALGQMLLTSWATAEESTPATRPAGGKPNESQATGPTIKLTGDELKSRLGQLDSEARKLTEEGEFFGLHDICQIQVELNIAAYGETSWNAVEAIAARESADRMVAASKEDQESLRDAFLALWSGHRLFQQGLIRPAISRVAKAVEIYSRMLGPDDAATLGAKLKLFEFEYGTSEFVIARQHASEVFVGLRSTLGENHLKTGIILSLIGLMEFKMGMPSESEEHLTQSVEILRRYLDDATGARFAITPYVLGLIHLSMLMNDHERFAQAEKLANEALICTVEKAPAGNGLDLMCKVQLARSHSGRENYVDATKLFKEVVATLESAPEPPPEPNFAHMIYVAYSKHLRKAGLTNEVSAVEEKVYRLAEELVRQYATAAREKAATINR